jgi:hypothetical protein
MGFEEGEGLIRGHEGAAFQHWAGLHDRGGRAEFGWGVVFSAAGGICRCELGRLRGRCAAGPSLEGQFVEVSCEDRGMFLEPCRVWQSGAGGGRDTDRETVGEALLEGIARDLAAERAVWRHLKPVVVETDVHPGFMTDWQQPLVVALTQAEGTSIVHETVYENRFGFTESLNKMGADIVVHQDGIASITRRVPRRALEQAAVITGPTPLHGADIRVPDLRGGFSHLIAALAASGTSTISNVGIIARGYEHFIDKLRDLGADFELAD